MIAVDRINQKFGPGTLFYAAAGLKRMVIGNQERITCHLDIPLSGANCLMHIDNLFFRPIFNRNTQMLEKINNIIRNNLIRKGIK